MRKPAPHVLNCCYRGWTKILLARRDAGSGFGTPPTTLERRMRRTTTRRPQKKGLTVCPNRSEANADNAKASVVTPATMSSHVAFEVGRSVARWSIAA